MLRSPAPASKSGLLGISVAQDDNAADILMGCNWELRTAHRELGADSRKLLKSLSQ